MKRGLLVITLGVAFLVAITWLGTFITNYFPSHPTPQVQTTQVGNYTVTLRVDPNPPSTEQPATFSIQIQQTDSHQPASNLHVAIDGYMEMDMSTTTSAQARAQGAGTYVAHVSLGMSGSWEIQVHISISGQPALDAIFKVATQ